MAFVPTQIEFNGMPNVRWWEFEDRRTDFGSINASTTDLPLLLLAEFGLVYGNDWFVVPYNLPVGSLAEIKGLIVTDVFGVRTLIRAAGQDQGMDWQRWSMFGLSTRAEPGVVDPRLLLAPALAKIAGGRSHRTHHLRARRDHQHGVGHRRTDPRRARPRRRWLRARHARCPATSSSACRASEVSPEQTRRDDPLPAGQHGAGELDTVHRHARARLARD